jgi:hypothetical protein
MGTVTMRWSVLGVVPAALAGAAVAAFIGLNGMEYQPAVPHTVSVAPGSIRLADSDSDEQQEQDELNQDQINEGYEQQAEEEEQEQEDQNAFDDQMNAFGGIPDN